MSFLERARKGWSVFRGKSEAEQLTYERFGPGVMSSLNQLNHRSFISNERSILASIHNRIAIDVASVSIRHVRLDQNGNYLEDIDSSLNQCLTVEANIDQAATQFKQDIIATLLEEGVVAIVPVETSANIETHNSFEIYNMRVGRITEWFSQGVTVDLYNERTGQREEITLPKKSVAIIESPLYSVMNEPNSTYQRLVRKLNYLDVIDEQSNSGRLDIIIQLPYTIKSETRLRQANERARNIENQLKDSKYGIAYIDGTEHITQLNRPSENNLLKQVEYLTDMLYGQMGITESVIAGTATEAEMLNYQRRTILPILRAVAEGMIKAFLTKTARSQGQSIHFFQNFFDMIPPTEIATWADKLTRNEIVTSNEMRAFIGLRPSEDPRADELLNKNMPRPEDPYYDEQHEDDEYDFRPYE